MLIVLYIHLVYRGEYKNITRADIKYIVDYQKIDKNRYTLFEKDRYIKCNYGHSFIIERNLKFVTPPDILYHGTSESVLQNIVEQGLLPLKRRYVYLTSEKSKAMEYAEKKNFSPQHRGYKHPILLIIDAKKAYEDGINFYNDFEHIYSTDNIPWKYIKRIKFSI